MSKRLGKNQQKLLLLLLGGVILGYSGSPKRYFHNLKILKKAWKNINKRDLQRAIQSLHTSKLVEEKRNADGTVTLVLSSEGRKRALVFNLGSVKIKKPNRWDKKWRIIIFDVPEKIKIARETLRGHLKNLQFYELQKSVFVHPYDCKDEMEYLVEYYNLRPYVRFILADHIDNELLLKKHFGLI